jgi:hypothetical protein
MARRTSPLVVHGAAISSPPVPRPIAPEVSSLAVVTSNGGDIGSVSARERPVSEGAERYSDRPCKISPGRPNAASKSTESRFASGLVEGIGR